MDHTIFHTPNAVTPTLVERPNPGYKLANPDGSSVPAMLDMWRVQTIGTFGEDTGSNRMFGLVSRGAGFEDSPDAEFISGGVNTKDYGAVALGRQGNQFHWGFSSSPTYMTDEAKLVFINAVHYISTFDGQGALVRKRSGTVLRDRLAVDAASLKTSLDALRANQPHGSIAVPQAGQSVARYFAEDDWEALSQDADEVLRRIDSDGPYLYPSGYFELSLDRQLQRLGVPNNAPDFLPRMAALLGSKTSAQSAVMMEILERYTEQSFEEPSQWKAWIEANRTRLFFSESAGYLWLVNE